MLRDSEYRAERFLIKMLLGDQRTSASMILLFTHYYPISRKVFFTRSVCKGHVVIRHALCSAKAPIFHTCKAAEVSSKHKWLSFSDSDLPLLQLYTCESGENYCSGSLPNELCINAHEPVMDDNPLSVEEADDRDDSIGVETEVGIATINHIVWKFSHIIDKK